MSSRPNARALEQCVAALQALGVVPAIAAPLAREADATAGKLLQQVVDEIAAFSSSANPDVLPELQRHLQDLVAEVCRLLGQSDPGDSAWLRHYAHTRAQQRFPLEALLHTYRCGHRIILAWIRDAGLTAADSSMQVRRVVGAVADFALEYTDLISTVATSEYVSYTRLLAETESDQRAELLNTLLSGYDESDTRAAQLLRRAGYLEQRQSFCVAVARSVDPREMENASRARRMVEAIGQILRETPVRSLIGVRDGMVTAVISGTRRLSGWTEPKSLLAERVYPQLGRVGPAALIGLSNDVPSTSHVRRAHNEARLALDFADVSNRVMRYTEIPFRQMLIRHARDNINAALPAWLAGLKAADGKGRGVLFTTLHAYADANMNALQTAKVLAVHPNTVYARMQKIADLTEKNPLRYHDLSEMLLAIDCDAQHGGVMPAEP